MATKNFDRVSAPAIAKDITMGGAYMKCAGFPYISLVVTAYVGGGGTSAVVHYSADGTNFYASAETVTGTGIYVIKPCAAFKLVAPGAAPATSVAATGYATRASLG